MRMTKVQVRGWYLRRGTCTPAGALLLTILLLSVLSAAPSAQAQTFTVLHRFTGKADGEYPEASVILDSKGNLYGTTAGGGSFDYGIAFKVNAQGKETVLHSFWGGDGLEPEAAFIRNRDGTLYSTTNNGGAPKGGGCVHGCGTVFALNPTGQLNVLYTFAGSTDGGQLAAGLIQDRAGTFYGVTVNGGNLTACTFGAARQLLSLRPLHEYILDGCGVVFKLDKTGKETVLYTFTWPNGAFPAGGLTRDDSGNLYGITGGGGSYGYGVVFKLNPSGTETVLYNFTGGPEQSFPNGTLVRDAAGNLYGVAEGNSGCGFVFKLDAAGKETVLHSFQGLPDGCAPVGGLLRDQAGNLYGTTVYGGKSCTSSMGCGTVFRIDARGNETVLYRFPKVSFATGGLIMDRSGNLYGTTAEGGDLSCGVRYGCGTVFKLTP